jgi:hypothetical protein
MTKSKITEAQIIWTPHLAESVLRDAEVVWQLHGTDLAHRGFRVALQ